jgi:hypothetical protein
MLESLRQIPDIYRGLKRFRNILYQGTEPETEELLLDRGLITPATTNVLAWNTGQTIPIDHYTLTKRGRIISKLMYRF